VNDIVVQTDNNEYYVDYGFNGNKQQAGTVFADWRCNVNDYSERQSDNIILYGHNQKDGTMFGNLKHYKGGEYEKCDIDFYAQNPVIYMRTFTGIDKYLIYGFFDTNTLAKHDSKGEVFYYHDFIEDIEDENVFYWYLNEIQRRNHIVSPVDVLYGDRLLLLSTCSNVFKDGRFVVVARKLRDGEDEKGFDFAAATPNYGMKGLDWSLIYETTASDDESETELADTENTEENIPSDTDVLDETDIETDAETNEGADTEAEIVAADGGQNVTDGTEDSPVSASESESAPGDAVSIE
jgi:SrtB family sortase